MQFWVGVVSRDHVRLAQQGGFGQLAHGKLAAIRRVSPGDRLLYYSPRTALSGGEPIQAFTAIGEVLPGEPYQVEMTATFRPFRRDVRYFDAADAAIRPLLPRLTFASGKASWGQVMRRGTFAISLDDYRVIAAAMKAHDAATAEQEERQT